MSLEKNISRLLSRKDEIEYRLVSSSLSPSELMNLSKELAEIRPVVEQAVKLQKLKTELDDALILLKDPEVDLDMKSLVDEEDQPLVSTRPDHRLDLSQHHRTVLNF